MEKTNIQKVSDALLCSNCGACKAVCPKDAISFSTTSLGRMFAVVNDSCIDCGLCVQVCPSLDRAGLHEEYPDRFIGDIKKVYVGKSTNDTIYLNAQSGGVCTAIISFLFDTNSIDCAVLCKMEYGNPPIVKPVIIENKEPLIDCQKSCYTPVDILSALKGTDKKKSIAIVGLPCHIQGVESLMRKLKKFHNIRYKIGLICDRTLCGGIQNVITSFGQKSEVKIAWRNKTPRTIEGIEYCYKNAPVTLSSLSGKEYVIPNTYRFALKEYFTSPRCRVCYDKLNSFSDITLGDPWGMSDVDWKNGSSVIITRTAAGEQLINDMIKADSLSLNEHNKEELIRGQRIEERRKTVAHYSKALQVIHVKIDSYLYKQNRELNNKTVKEEKELKDFMRRDVMTEEEILRKSKEIIKIYITQQRINKLFIVKLLRKIKRILKL